MKYSIRSHFNVALLRLNKTNVCFCVSFNAERLAAVPLGYEDKAMEGNCFVLLMNDDEYTRVLCACICWGKSQVFKACYCYK